MDTLSRWMAHYIAEKMTEVEIATAEIRPQKMAECRDVILKLWTHRSELPKGKQPFERFEPIFRVIESLDLNNTTPRLFRHIREIAGKDDEDNPSKKWLGIASALDYTARILIRYCIAVAAQEATEKSREWITLAEAVANSEDNDIQCVRFIFEDVDALSSENPDDQEKARIEDLLTRLDRFTHFANELSAYLRQRLTQVTEGKKG